MPHITGTDVSARIGPAAYRRLLDEDNDGTADPTAVTQVVQDSIAKCLGYCRGIYDLDAINANVPDQLKRLELDVAVAYLAQRHPEAVRLDWQPLLDYAEKDLKRLRTGEIRLDVVGSPEPAANEGGDFSVGDPNGFDESTFKRTFLDGTGDF